MELRFLGSGAAEGWPAMFCRCQACRSARVLGGKNVRTRHQALLDRRWLFDLGPDTYHHVLTHGVDLAEVEHIFITHSHPDHLAPGELFFRRTDYGFARDLPGPLHVYGNDRVLAFLERDVPDFRRVGIELHLVQPFVPFAAGEAVVLPLRANHAQNETCLNYLVTHGDKTCLYAHDTAYWGDDTWHHISQWALEGGVIDLASLDCCNGPMNQSTGGHMNIAECATFAAELQRRGAAVTDTVVVASHFSHNIGLLHDEIAMACEAAGLVCAYDGLVVRA